MNYCDYYKISYYYYYYNIIVIIAQKLNERVEEQEGEEHIKMKIFFIKMEERGLT